MMYPYLPWPVRTQTEAQRPQLATASQESPNLTNQEGEKQRVRRFGHG